MCVRSKLLLIDIKSMLVRSLRTTSEQFSHTVPNAQCRLTVMRDCRDRESVSVVASSYKKMCDDRSEEEIALDIFDLIKTIKDPERPESLEDLEVLTEESVTVHRLTNDLLHAVVTFVPTVPHCSLASLIGLCIREKLKRTLPFRYKLNIYVKEGTHSIEEDVNKQINDKERVAAAMENPNLLELIDTCIEES